MTEKKLDLQDQMELSRRLGLNPVFRALKEKWDGKIPRKNSKAFETYRDEATVAQESQQKIVDDYLAEELFTCLNCGQQKHLCFLENFDKTEPGSYACKVGPCSEE